ncbi:MAG TPA: ABC transporter permease [Chloroflexota bacterium]|nr:ABC transporter permease [Chloroflexota bacterium]
MAKYFAKRLLLAVPTLFGVTLLVFTMVRLIPGDIVDMLVPADIYVGPEYRAQMRAMYGLDQPIYVQYVRWISQVAQGNLGSSLRNNEPIAKTLITRLPLTMELAFFSVVLSALVAIPLGIVSAVKRNSVVDFVARVLAMFGLSVPSFWLASMLLLVTSVVLHWQPDLRLVPLWQDPLTNLSQLAMPIVALSLALMAIVMRMTRSAMLEVLRQDYMQTARAKGLLPRVIMVRHALRNAFIPVLTVLGIQIGGLLGGTVVIEQIFGLPGVGRTLLEGVTARDYPVIQGTVLFIAVVFVVVNLVVDLLYAAVDPRIKYG